MRAISSVTTAQEMCKQLEQLDVQPELKAFLNQMCINLKYRESQIDQLKIETIETHYLLPKIKEVERYFKDTIFSTKNYHWSQMSI